LVAGTAGRSPVTTSVAPTANLGLITTRASRTRRTHSASLLEATAADRTRSANCFGAVCPNAARFALARSAGFSPRTAVPNSRPLTVANPYVASIALAAACKVL